MSFDGFEHLRQRAIKICTEATVIVVFIILLLLILAIFFFWLEWRGVSNKPLNRSVWRLVGPIRKKLEKWKLDE